MHRTDINECSLSSTSTNTGEMFSRLNAPTPNPPCPSVESFFTILKPIFFFSLSYVNSSSLNDYKRPKIGAMILFKNANTYGMTTLKIGWIV